VLLHTELRLCRQNKVDISVHWINKVWIQNKTFEKWQFYTL
jgi:hypothetical protein